LHISGEEVEFLLHGGTVDVSGGNGFEVGASGTVYIIQNSQGKVMTHLIIDNARVNGGTSAATVVQVPSGQLGLELDELEVLGSAVVWLDGGNFTVWGMDGDGSSEIVVINGTILVLPPTFELHATTLTVEDAELDGVQNFIVDQNSTLRLTEVGKAGITSLAGSYFFDALNVSSNGVVEVTVSSSALAE
ncbi:unnamed protein product, partial [Choristocarpus tenellus]